MTNLVIYFPDEIPPELLKKFDYKSVEDLQVHLLEENDWDIVKMPYMGGLLYQYKISKMIKEYPHLQKHLTPHQLTQYQRTFGGKNLKIKLTPADHFFFSLVRDEIKLKGHHNFFVKKIEDTDYIVVEKYCYRPYAYSPKRYYSDLKSVLTKWWNKEVTDKELTTWQDFEQVKIGIAYRGGSGYSYGLTEIKLETK